MISFYSVIVNQAGNFTFVRQRNIYADVRSRSNAQIQIQNKSQLTNEIKHTCSCMPIRLVSSAVSRKAALRKCKGRFRRHNFALRDELRKDAPSKSLNVRLSGHVNVNVRRYFGGDGLPSLDIRERSLG